ncbi:MAG: DUF2492 family protein [Acidobacteria bacterium]|nr:DUF2492 family protein [Acidobacteriota bacterium]
MSEQSQTTEGIYGHEVLRILADHQGAMPVEALRTAAAETFGPGAVFCNCHGDSFDFDGLLAFLASRGKLVVQGGVAALGWVPGCEGH